MGPVMVLLPLRCANWFGNRSANLVNNRLVLRSLQRGQKLSLQITGLPDVPNCHWRWSSNIGILADSVRRNWSNRWHLLPS